MYQLVFPAICCRHLTSKLLKNVLGKIDHCITPLGTFLGIGSDLLINTIWVKSLNKSTQFSHPQAHDSSSESKDNMRGFGKHFMEIQIPLLY